MLFVFDNYQPQTAFEERGKMTGIDLCEFIAGINHILDLMPKTTFTDWVEHLVIKDFEHLAIVIRHSGTGEKNLICVGLDANIQLEIDAIINLLNETLSDKLSGSNIHIINNSSTISFNWERKQIDEWSYARNTLRRDDPFLQNNNLNL